MGPEPSKMHLFRLAESRQDPLRERERISVLNDPLHGRRRVSFSKTNIFNCGREIVDLEEGQEHEMLPELQTYKEWHAFVDDDGNLFYYALSAFEGPH